MQGWKGSIPWDSIELLMNIWWPLAERMRFLPTWSQQAGKDGLQIRWDCDAWTSEGLYWIYELADYLASVFPPPHSLPICIFKKLQLYLQMSGLHSRKPGNFQTRGVRKESLSSNTKTTDLGRFLLKFDIIWKFVTKGAWNLFESMPLGDYWSLLPAFLKNQAIQSQFSRKQFKFPLSQSRLVISTITLALPFRYPLWTLTASYVTT